MNRSAIENKLRGVAVPPISFSPLLVNNAEVKDSIAIIGISFRLPGANTLEEFWSLLKEGREGIIKVPEWRWGEESNFTEGNAANVRETEAGFLTCPVLEIDAKFFGLSPKELAYLDPQQRLILELVWEGLEHACINPGKLRNSQTGVFGGWWRNEYKEILQEAGGLQSNEFFRTYMGNTIATLTSRISHILELTGPSISTESGCSTSMVAVDMACKSLLNEDCDLALAFGVNLFLHPFTGDDFAKSIMAPDGRSKTFDADADGFGRAEGCTVLVLKRYADALNDNDRIWGLIRGTAVVQEGLSKSIGTPTVHCEALAMKLALQDAGVDPEQVEFVEAHGTGTAVGDPLEIAAIAEAYGRGRKVPLTIGSVKTNIGHTESCSGIAGIIKTILAMEHEMIPRHINFKTLNPEIDLDVIPATIPVHAIEWKRGGGRPRIAGVSSFGITGTDAHAVIQEPPSNGISLGLNLNEDTPLHIMKLSAKTDEALASIKEIYKDFLLQENNNLCAADIAYSANVGRADLPFRSYTIGKKKEELAEELMKTPFTKKPQHQNKLCFLFTGQGSQYPGMAKSLYEKSPLFKAHFDECSRILKDSYKISIKDAMWGEESDQLKRSIYSQTSIFCVEYCLLKLWESWGVKPDCVLGHSLGEFAAAVAAEILTFEDALSLVATRSSLIDSLPQGKMLVLKANYDSVQKYLEKFQSSQSNKFDIDFAAVNSVEQTVVAGGVDSILAFKEFCVNNGMKTHVLDATHAFHSRHMDPILDSYGKLASKITYRKPSCTFVSGMEGRLLLEEEVTSKYWVDHTRKGVEFFKASKAVLEDVGCNLFLEIGPQPVLSSLLMENADNFGLISSISCFPSIRKKEEEWSTMLSSLGKLYISNVDVDWDAFHQYSKGHKVTLPYYPFQKKSYNFEVEREKPRCIHPLVGSVVSNPSEMKIFQNNLSLEQAPFLKDHVIGSTYLFPGAAFLEMLLTAGYAGTQCLEGSYQPPVSPITIQDFQIEAPLALQENSKTNVQLTLAEVNGENKVTMFSKLQLDKGTFKWVKHASSTFVPLDTLDKIFFEKLHNDNFTNFQSRCNAGIETGKAYTQLAEHGYKFGPTFQTLKKAWRNPDSEEEFLCEVAVTCKSDGHILHPVLIDAMFQATMLL
jgi:acyl transferase domain-containing protein